MNGRYDVLWNKVEEDLRRPRRVKIAASIWEQEEELSSLPLLAVGEIPLFDEEFARLYGDFFEHRRKRTLARIKELEEEKLFVEFLLREEGRRKKKTLFYGIALENKKRDIEEAFENLAQEDPVAFYTVKGYFWDRERERLGNLIVTPYVEKGLKDIVRALHRGEAVFLRGHLGSGKTELAMAAAQVFARENYVDRYVRQRMSFPPKKDEVLELFKEGERRFKEEDPGNYRPYFIAGNKDIRATDLFTEKVLTLQGALEGKTIEEAMEEEWREYKRWEEGRGQKADNEDFREVRALYRLKHGSFGTKVEKQKREVLLAILEGRPLVIDELNAIAMEHLIGLNDLLQKKPGDDVYITGVGQVQVKEGFGLIATGNLSSESVLYGGTDELNPAFASRFYGFEYSYLPQEEHVTLGNREHPEKDELFRVVISLLADDEGNLILPGGLPSLRKLYALCQYGAVTQDIFSGRFRRATELFGDGLEPELTGAVLSMRALGRVLEEWNLGVSKDLDTALWDGFIRSVTSEDDVNVLMNLARMYGFFSTKEGWEVPRKGVGEAAVTLEEIRKNPSGYRPPKPEVFTREEVLELLFGEVPDFGELPSVLEKYLTEENISPEQFLTLQERLKSMEDTTIIESILEEE